MKTTTRSTERDRAIRTVKQAKDNATRMMKESGFDIGETVRVRIDPNLGFMGYTMPANDGTYMIVVAGAAVDSGMLEGLLIHEMSHVYRMRSQHPSHNANIIEEAVESFGKNNAQLDYQRKIMHDILNDIQDLYADDISFNVLRKNRILPMEDLTRFLQSWVKDKPEDFHGKDARAERWTNGSILVHNARALAQMTRHQIDDKDNNAVQANKAFLSKLSTSMTENFDYFQNMLTRLPENLTADSYRKLLRQYIGKFLETVQEN